MSITLNDFCQKYNYIFEYSHENIVFFKHQNYIYKESDAVIIFNIDLKYRGSFNQSDSHKFMNMELYNAMLNKNENPFYQIAVCVDGSETIIKELLTELGQDFINNINKFISPKIVQECKCWFSAENFNSKKQNNLRTLSSLNYPSPSSSTRTYADGREAKYGNRTYNEFCKYVEQFYGWDSPENQNVIFGCDKSNWKNY